jgi:hypothetical protein
MSQALVRLHRRTTFTNGLNQRMVTPSNPDVGASFGGGIALPPKPP